MEKTARLRVAVVGSGMAGLVTAHILKQDPRRRYDVEIYESGSGPSLDFASVSVPNQQTGEMERIDVPMRAFTEGYYHNLKDMYDHLGVRYRVQPFVFSFSKLLGHRDAPASLGEERQYFVHASNNHRFPPLRPETTRLLSYVAELLFALLCYVWFSVCCVYIPTKEDTDEESCESFGQYLRRIRVPQFFVRFYLLPLMSAVTTCPHKTLLAFPASDVVRYKKCITSGRQLTVSAGVNEVQRKLIHGVKAHFSAQVIAVQPQEQGTRILWRDVSQNNVIRERMFERVIMAVPPNVVGSIFEPLRKEMRLIPTTPVDTVVHRDDAGVNRICRSMRQAGKSSWFTTSDAERAHVIHLRTTGGADACTEATHVQPCGAMVTSCPLFIRDPSAVVRSSTFTRVLRTPESRRRVNDILRLSKQRTLVEEKCARWRNGDAGVYLVGSWCWDGMVLLEGCVVSAMQTASALGVDVPWKHTNWSS